MYGNEQKAIDLLKRCQKDARGNTARQARDRADLLNLKKVRGGKDNAFLVWDGQNSTYITRPTSGEAGLPEWFFRATSNLLSTNIDGIASILNQSQPAKNWYPTKEDDKSRAAADVAELADPVLLDEISYPHNLRPRLNKLVSLTNLAAVVVTYDNDPKWGLQQIPVLQCASCQQYVNPMDAPDEAAPCPECGQGQLDWAMHPQTNLPLGVDYPKGRLHAEMLTSFEVSLPSSAATAHEDFVPWVASHQRWAVEDALSRWNEKLKPILGGGKTGVGGGKSTEQAYADQVRHLSSPVASGSAQNVAGSAAYTGPVIWRLWHDPIDDDDFYFPDGVFMTVLESEDVVLDCGPLPFKNDEGQAFKNVVIRQYTTTPGASWGHPPADDLVPLQEQLDLAQSLAFLILMHHASPRTFVPSTVTLHDKLSGMPGKDIGFRALVPGDKPITEPGIGFPEALKWFLDFIIQSFDKVSKLNAVLTGQRPQGDPTLGEVEILQERGFAAFQEPLEQLVAFEKRLSLKLLWITRESGWAERYRRLLGDNGDWKLQAFTGADLDGHVTVDIDLATAWPKSPMLTNLRLSKAFELGILNPQDPEVQEEYLKMNDLLGFKTSTDVDRDQVARQLEVWKSAQAPQQIEPPQTYWRLDYHLFRKSQFLKTEEFEALRQENPPVAQAMVAHVQQLQQMLAPPPDPAAAGDAPIGAGGALKDALAKGLIKPAAAKGSKGALPSAVASGAIRPAGTGAAMQAHTAKQKRPSVGALVKKGVIRPAGKPSAPARTPNAPSAAPTSPGAAS